MVFVGKNSETASQYIVELRLTDPADGLAGRLHITARDKHLSIGDDKKNSILFTYIYNLSGCSKVLLHFYFQKSM